MVAENTTRRVDIILSAKDNASVTLDRATMNVRRLKAEASESLVYGPAVKPRFGDFEQEARDIAAGKLRALRAAESREQLQLRARQILSDAPGQAPLRTVNRSADDQAIRDMMAQRIRSMREAARQARISEQANLLLFGPQSGGQSVARAAGEKVGQTYGKGFLEAIKKNFGRGSTFQESAELLKGGGAFIGGRIAIEMETRAVDGLAEAFRKANEGTFEWNGEMIRSLPIMGDLIASSGHLYAELGKFLHLPEPVTAFLSGGFSLADKESARRAAEEQRVNRADEQQQKVESIRAFAQSANEGGRSSANQRRLIGLTGEGAAIEQNTQQTGSELDRIQAERDKLENATITTDKKILAERKAAMAALDEQSRQAILTSEANAAEIRKKYQKQREDDARDSEQRINSIKADMHQKALQAEGFTLAAQLSQLKASYQEQIQEVANAEQKKIDAAKSSGRDQDVPAIQQEANSQRNALTDQYNQSAAIAQQQANRDAEEEERSHQQNLLDIQTRTAAERLRLQGRDAEAEQLELRAAHARRLQEIQDAADKEKLIHAEQSQDIQRRAEDDKAAENESFAVSLDAERKRRAKEFELSGVATNFDPNGGTGFTERSQEDTKTDEIKQFTSQTAENTKAANALLQRMLTLLQTPTPTQQIGAF